MGPTVFRYPTPAVSWLEKEIGKGKDEYLYSAFIQRLVSRRPDMDHTVLPANFTMPAFPS